MAFHKTVETRLQQLIDQSRKVDASKRSTGGSSGRVVSMPQTYVDETMAHQWTMNVLTIFRSAFGEQSDYYQRTSKHLDNCGIYRNFLTVQSYLKAALDDLRGGYFFEAKTLLEAEVFVDLLEQAEELSKAGYKDAAAVMVGSVLEQHLRSMCTHRGIGLTKPNGKRRMINDMNDELAKAGAYNALKKKQIIGFFRNWVYSPGKSRFSRVGIFVL